jgi:hypothetical protein
MIEKTGTIRQLCVIVAAGLIAGALGVGTASAQTQVLTINASVLNRAELVLTPTTINFADANPTTTPSIAADSTVSVTARVRTSGTPTLRVLAAADLTAGANTIAIGNVTWTASAAPFIAGTMNRVTAQDAATFAAGSGQYTGTYTYALANSWSYSVGSYSTTATYTLTAP